MAAPQATASGKPAARPQCGQRAPMGGVTPAWRRSRAYRKFIGARHNAWAREKRSVWGGVGT